jgi:undecaprenyl-diphosphatase
MLRLIRSRLPDRKILVAFLLAAVMVFLFAKFVSEVMEGDTLAIDRHLIGALRSTDNPALPIGPRWFTAAMRDITALGGITCLTLVTTSAIGYLLVVRRAAMAAFVLFAVVGGAVGESLLKLMFNRPRPDIVLHLVEVSTTSFPSGHAMNSAVVYLTLGALIARTQASFGVRAYIMVLAVALTLLIGFSRVFLGVHWPSDVVAGWILGSAWALVCSMAAQRSQLSRVSPERHD